MNDQLLQQFLQLIATHTGLHIREQDRQNLAKKIYARMKLLNISSPEHYYQLLNASNGNSSVRETPSDREWKELALQLTIGESYFFRDRGQIGLLKNTILPKLIEQKRQESTSNQAKPSLRIWSAGCSTGEEVYSLAILVKELIPDIHNWQILLLGTDLNLESINKAKRGTYEAWSFRMVDPEIKKNYFNQRQQSWEVKQQIRSLVKFQVNNLIKDPFPNTATDIYGMDIIICRNVFIYFNSQSIATVLEKFYQTLVTGGYLIAGHTELQGQKLGQLQLKAFPESIVYQRAQNSPQKAIVVNASLVNTGQKQPSAIRSNAVLKHKLPATNLNPTYSKSVALTSTATPTRSPANTRQIETPLPTDLSQAETLFHAGEYQKAIQAAQQIIQQQPQNFEAHYLLAQAWANLGDYKQAEDCCQNALKINDLSEKVYYILAQIAEEKGNIEQTKALFKKIIYLAPSSIGAYVELSYIYEREGDRDRAYKILKIIRDLLKDLPFDFTIESAHNMKASELLQQIKARLRSYK